jgi:hypothetical protein
MTICINKFTMKCFGLLGAMKQHISQGAIVHFCASVVPDQIVGSWRIVKSEWTMPWLCQTYFSDSRKVD